MDNNERIAALPIRPHEQNYPTKIYLPKAGAGLAAALRHNLQQSLNCVKGEFYGSMHLYAKPYTGVAEVIMFSDFYRLKDDELSMETKAEACWQCTEMQARSSCTHFDYWVTGGFSVEADKTDLVSADGECPKADVYHTPVHHALILNGSTGCIIGTSCVMDGDFRHNTKPSAYLIEFLFQATALTLKRYLTDDVTMTESINRILSRKYLSKHGFAMEAAILQSAIRNYFIGKPVDDDWLAWYQQIYRGDSMVALGARNRQEPKQLF